MDSYYCHKMAQDENNNQKDWQRVEEMRDTVGLM